MCATDNLRRLPQLSPEERRRRQGISWWERMVASHCLDEELPATLGIGKLIGYVPIPPKDKIASIPISSEGEHVPDDRT